MQITRCPLPSRCSQRCEPRKPAPPVTTQVRHRAPMLSGPGAAEARCVDFLQFARLRGRKSVQMGGENGSGTRLALPCLVQEN